MSALLGMVLREVTIIVEIVNPNDTLRGAASFE
jgi:hypothetical protein